MNKILIVKTSALGDIIHAFSVLEYLHNKFPKATIDWVVEEPFRELLEQHPLINKAVIISSKKWRKNLFCKTTWQEIFLARNEIKKTPYDLVIDLQGNIKSGFVTLFSNGFKKVGFGFKSAPEKLNCLFTNCRYNPFKGQNIRDDYLSLVCQHFNEPLPQIIGHFNFKITNENKKAVLDLMGKSVFVGNKKVMVCPGSFWPNKQLKLDDLLQFLKNIQKETRAAFIFIWGNENEKKIVESLYNHFKDSSIIAEKMKLTQLQMMMSLCDLVVTMDSLPLHLAATTKVSTFSFFGPSTAKKYAPIGSQHTFFQGSCPYGKVFEKRCPILRTCKTGACLHGIDFPFGEQNRIL